MTRMAFAAAASRPEQLLRERAAVGWGGSLTGNALPLVIDLFFTLMFVAIMLAWSPRLTLFVVTAILLFAAVVLSLSPVPRRQVQKKFNRGAENQAFLVESIAGIETATSTALEPQLQRRRDNQLAGYTHAIFRAAHPANLGSHLIQTVAKLVTAAILFPGAHAVIAGKLTVGQFIALSRSLSALQWGVEAAEPLATISATHPATLFGRVIAAAKLAGEPAFTMQISASYNALVRRARLRHFVRPAAARDYHPPAVLRTLVSDPGRGNRCEQPGG